MIYCLGILPSPDSTNSLELADLFRLNSWGTATIEKQYRRATEWFHSGKTLMNPSNHLWPDPATDIQWEVWSDDTFDHEAPQTMDTRGQGLLDGLTALWIRFLLETVSHEGNQGFTRFYLRRPPAAAINIKGSSEGAKRLRYWVFGTKKREIRNYLMVADRWLLEIVIHIHAKLLAQEQSSESILKIAAEADDQQGFETRMDELARSFGINVNQGTRNKARQLQPLVYSEKREKKQVAIQKKKGHGRKASQRGILGNVDYQLLGSAVFLVLGLIFLFIFGRGFTLSCERLESNLASCTHEQNLMGLIGIGKQPVEGLRRARVGQVCDRDGCSMFPELENSSDAIRLESGSSDLSPNQEIVDRINAYLEDTAVRDLELVVTFRPARLIIPLALILGGIGFFCAWAFKRLRKPK